MRKRNVTAWIPGAPPAAGRRWGLASVVLAIALAAQACDATPDAVKREARERQLRRAGIESFDPAGGAPLAGVSARRAIRVEPLGRGELGADTATSVYHSFVHRCSACHPPPSPRQHADWEWEFVVRRMAARVDSAGLLPLDSAERHAILGLLSRNARKR